jgi:subtilisin-like proprotein convertase family protein
MNLPVSDLLPKSASLYPSAIAVRGLEGKIRDVNLRLNDVSHTNAADVEVLLVGPSGQTAVVMADVGEETEGDNAVTLRFDDEATAPLPDAVVQSGAFRPTNHNGRVVAFNAPAPIASASAALSVFDGGDANGTWRLFVQDGFLPADVGAIAGGWTLEIATRTKGKRKR